MVNEAQISLSGYVARQPVPRHMTDGTVKLELRVAWTPRWLDKATGQWVDGFTSYATVNCWRKMAANAAISLRKGDPVMVRGRLTVRPYEKDGVRRESVEIEASSIGHDLTHGVATFSRLKPKTGMSGAEFEAAQSGAAATAQADGQPGSPDGETPAKLGVGQLIDERELAHTEAQEMLGPDEDIDEGGGGPEPATAPDAEPDAAPDTALEQPRAIGRNKKERAAIPA
jgi:single-strand DNA-binding protein